MSYHHSHHTSSVEQSRPQYNMIILYHHTYYITHHRALIAEQEQCPTSGISFPRLHKSSTLFNSLPLSTTFIASSPLRLSEIQKPSKLLLWNAGRADCLQMHVIEPATQRKAIQDRTEQDTKRHQNPLPRPFTAKPNISNPRIEYLSPRLKRRRRPINGERCARPPVTNPTRMSWVSC